MKNILIVVVLLVASLLLFYFYSADDKSVVVAGNEKTKETNVVSKDQSITSNPVTKESADENSVITAEDPKAEELLEENKPTNLAISESDLLKAMGATDSLKWKEEYDKGEYDPAYDQTWQDDMFNRAYELILEEKYSSNVDMSEIECKDNQCGLKLRKLPESSRSVSSVASDFMLDMRNHPAIIKSGKRRNIYINSIRNEEGGRTVDLVIR